MRYNSAEPFPSICTERLTLRRMTQADAPALFALRSIESVTRFTGCGMSEFAQAQRYIEKIDATTQKGDCVFWAIDIGSAPPFCGNICLWNFSADGSSAEMGYELFPVFHGKGYMSEALRAVVHYAFDTLALDYVFASPDIGNAPSHALLIRNGFVAQPGRIKEKAPDGRTLEFCEYRLLSDTYRADEQEP